MAKSITRVPLCGVKGCPAPSSPEWHSPWCGHGLAGTHHHTTKRSQGGKDSVQVYICPKCHDAIDNRHTLEDRVIPFPALGEWRYVIFKDNGAEREYRCEKVIDPPWWEGEIDERPAVSALRTISSAGVRDVHQVHDGEEVDAEVRSRQADNGVLPEVHEGVAGQDKATDARGGDASPSTGNVRTSPRKEGEYADLRAKGRQIITSFHSLKGAKSTLRWALGDYVIEVERTAGHAAHQIVAETVLSPVTVEVGGRTVEYKPLKVHTVQNVVSVCERIPEERRRYGLEFGAHAIIAYENVEDQEKWLDAAVKNGWGRRELHEAIYGPKPEKMGRCPECKHEAKLAEFKQ